MKNAIISFIVGLIFSVGLGISGMTNPQKVFGFLDVFGKFDPSLIFVMVGAIAVHFILYKIIRKKTTPLFDQTWHVPTKKDITPSLIIGSFLFGVGWALGGFCPGPALVSLGAFSVRSFVFLISMVIGMFIFHQLDKRFHFKR
jgi:uncharacterized protein